MIHLKLSDVEKICHKYDVEVSPVRSPDMLLFELIVKLDEQIEGLKQKHACGHNWLVIPGVDDSSFQEIILPQYQCSKCMQVTIKKPTSKPCIL